MTHDELARRRQRADNEPLVVAKLPQGFRVHSPTGRTQPYLVTGSPDDPACTCPDFQAHADDPDWHCKHILAVFRDLGPVVDHDDAETREERAAIQAESGNGDGPTGRNGITQMLIKRSVSPDGRIDALSVEFACAADGESVAALTARAQEVLRIQSGIADAFLRRNGRGQAEPPLTLPRPMEPETATAGRPIPAQLVRVGSSDGKWGRRLFLTIAADSRMLRLYGTPTQLAAHVTRAGYPDLAEELAEGQRLDVPCRIVTKGRGDGGFVSVERVLPAAPLREPAA